MATTQGPGAAVRIELSNNDGSIVAPPAQSTGGGGGGRAIGVVLLGLLVVATLIWLTRPDEGQTAAGTPIAVPTTLPPETETSGVVDGPDDLSVAPPETKSEGVTDIDGTERSEFESVELGEQLISMVQADLGWIAFGLDISKGAPAGALFRSDDGLSWTRFANESLPDGDVMGLDRINGQYLIAVDEARTWSQQFDSDNNEVPDHSVSVWTSPDAVFWTLSDLPSVEGNGFPLFVTFTEDSYVVPMVGRADDSHVLLVELLAPFVDAETAAIVCSWNKTFETAIPTVELRSCDGRLLAEVTADEFPDDFERVWTQGCLEQARSISSQRLSVMRVERGGQPSRIELPASASLFGRAVPTGFVSVQQPYVEPALSAACGGSGDGVVITDDSSVTLWSPTSEERDVTPPTLGSPDSRWLSGRRGLTRGMDDRYYVVFDDAVWAGTAPFDDWERVLTPPVDISDVETTKGYPPLSLSLEGRHALFAVPGSLYVAPVDGAWTHVDFDEPFGSVEIVVATDEYVIIAVSGRNGVRLAKVPLP